MIYLDHAATTPVDPTVAQGLAERQATLFGNPSSRHAAGQAARQVLEQSRAGLAQLLGGQAHELVFTSGATEALALAIIGAAGQRPSRIAVSAVEHQAVMRAAEYLAERQGWTVDRIPADDQGRITPAAVEAVVGPDTRIVAVMLANNEVGTLNDCAAIGRLLRRIGPRARFVVDAVQAFGKVPFNVRDLEADSVAVTAHKLNGPKGIGALWTRTTLRPVQAGGGQEHGLRGGTQPVPLVWAFAAAAQRAFEQRPVVTPTISQLRDRFVRAVQQALPDAVLNGPPAGPDRMFNNAHIRVPGVPSEPLVNALAEEGICLSTGSSCSSSSGRAPFSHVLAAMGLSPQGAYIRCTLGPTTQADEIDEAARRLVAAVHHLRPFYA